MLPNPEEYHPPGWWEPDDGEDDFPEDDLEEDEEYFDCGYIPGEGCTMAGSEDCDFECPYRFGAVSGRWLTPFKSQLFRRRRHQFYPLRLQYRVIVRCYVGHRVTYFSFLTGTII